MNGQEQSKTTAGCGKGCLIAVAVVVLLVVVGGLGTWWMYGQMVGMFTANRQANVTVDSPAYVAVQQAESKLAQLRNAVRNQTEATIEFSAADLNTLVARDPAFSGLRGKTRVDLSGYDMILDLSVPTDSVPRPRFKGRWFNGRVRFGCTYDDGQFSFEARALEANGHRIVSGGPGFATSFLKSFSSSYSRSFNHGFANGRDRNPQGQVFWKQIKSISVQNGMLVVTTRAGG